MHISSMAELEKNVNAFALIDLGIATDQVVKSGLSGHTGYDLPQAFCQLEEY
jgi:hypothetical protein